MSKLVDEAKMMVMEMRKREKNTLQLQQHKNDAQNPITFTAATRQILFFFFFKKKGCTEEEPQHKNDLDSELGKKQQNKIK